MIVILIITLIFTIQPHLHLLKTNKNKTVFFQSKQDAGFFFLTARSTRT